MSPLMGVVVGGLYACGIFMMLRRSLFQLVLGLVLLSHGANLLLFVSGGLTRAQPPIIPEQLEMAVQPSADPLPQAMMLTAIVISFSVLAFALVLFRQAHQVTGTDDADALRETQ